MSRTYSATKCSKRHKDEASHRGLPGREGSHGGPEAGHSPGPTLPEGLFYQLAFGGGVDPPEGALAGLLLRAGHFDEVAV